MKKVLSVVAPLPKLYHYSPLRYSHYGRIISRPEVIEGKNISMRGDVKGLRGDCTNLHGDCSGITGDCTGVFGVATRLYGCLDEVGLTPEERKKGVDIMDLTRENECQ